VFTSLLGLVIVSHLSPRGLGTLHRSSATPVYGLRVEGDALGPLHLAVEPHLAVGRAVTVARCAEQLDSGGQVCLPRGRPPAEGSGGSPAGMRSPRDCLWRRAAAHARGGEPPRDCLMKSLGFFSEWALWNLDGPVR
jgi:hypothetical protein